MEYLTLTNSTEIIRIASEDIVFIKGDGNYSDIYPIQWQSGERNLPTV